MYAVTEYPGISPADVHAAMAYYFDNVEEIQDGFRKDEEVGAMGRGEPALADPARNEREARW